MHFCRSLLPGAGLVLVLTVVATWLGKMFPAAGGAVIGMLLGIAVRSFIPLPLQCLPGVRFSSKQVLQYSIIALGACLPIAEVARTGVSTLFVTLATISAAFLSALCFGRLLKIPAKLCVLIGTGTAICGGSAISAIVPVLKPSEHEITFSLATIFLFNVVAVLVFPQFGHFLGLSDQGFGLWAGTAINDTSSVVAAAYSWSRDAGEYATIVKLTRAMLIVPVTLLIGAVSGWQQRKSDGDSMQSIRVQVPWFIVGFLLASGAGSFLPAIIVEVAQTAAHFMITGALAAIGLSTDLSKMRQTGIKPVVLGLLVWICVASTSLAVQYHKGFW
ncbi:conserved hypothetical integral membrane protein [Formivibrio citricus]|uniref:Conserved hypothetical integral membrane protein n=1 Tax=Formivibrio citricus TaxID=83765 RepID=A0A1I5AEH4_9NEIS|nr:conserved hypothetical integral membrane protein [Formivibrio citricus]